MAQVVEHLVTMHEALESISRIAQKKYGYYFCIALKEQIFELLVSKRDLR
jgi:hypothetical protein